MKQKSTYICGKKSVDKALSLLKVKQTRKRKKLKRNLNKYQTDNSSAEEFGAENSGHIVNYEKMSKYCVSTVRVKEMNLLIAGFFHSFCATQMRMCIMRHDWLNLEKLILLVLNTVSFKESFIWSYALSVFLNKSQERSTYLHRFVDKCINFASNVDLIELGQFHPDLLLL